MKKHILTLCFLTFQAYASFPEHVQTSESGDENDLIEQFLAASPKKLKSTSEESGIAQLTEELLSRAADRSATREEIALLLEKGANLSLYNDNGHTPLHLAASSGAVSTCALLIQYGATIDAPIIEYRDHAFKRQLQKLPIMLTRWATPNFSGTMPCFGSTALHCAAKSGQGDICVLLLNHEADINRKNDNGETPFCLAIQNNHKEVAQILVDRGAYVTPDNGWKKTVEAIIPTKDRELFKLLVSHLFLTEPLLMPGKQTELLEHQDAVQEIFTPSIHNQRIRAALLTLTFWGKNIGSGHTLPAGIRQQILISHSELAHDLYLTIVPYLLQEQAAGKFIISMAKFPATLQNFLVEKIYARTMRRLHTVLKELEINPHSTEILMINSATCEEDCGQAIQQNIRKRLGLA